MKAMSVQILLRERREMGVGEQGCEEGVIVFLTNCIYGAYESFPFRLTERESCCKSMALVNMCAQHTGPQH